MGIRETLNEKPAIVTGITIGVVVLVLGVVFFQSCGGGGGAPGAGSGKAKGFYSIDDGANYFVDDADKIPPFDYKGKQAVRAYVFSCDGKPFVAYLERFTPEGKKKMEASLSGGRKDPTVVIADTGREVKAPLKGDWVNQNDPKANAIMTPKCSGQLEVYSP